MTKRFSVLIIEEMINGLNLIWLLGVYYLSNIVQLLGVDYLSDIAEFDSACVMIIPLENAILLNLILHNILKAQTAPHFCDWKTVVYYFYKGMMGAGNTNETEIYYLRAYATDSIYSCACLCVSEKLILKVHFSFCRKNWHQLMSSNLLSTMHLKWPHWTTLYQ